jgi:pilus assembly protein CpaC
MTDYQTRNGRTGSRFWFWPLLLFLAVLGLLLTAGSRAQAQTQETKIITIPPPLPRPMQRPGGSPAGPTAAVPAEAVEFPPAATGSEIEARVGMPSPFSRQDAVPPPPAPGQGIPRVIPIEPLPGQLQGQTPTAARPNVIQLRRDSTGLVPGRPPGPVPRRSNDEVASDVSNLIESWKDGSIKGQLKILEPEAEIALVAGECKVIQTKQILTRVVVANPQVADVELLVDEPESRFLNVTGKSFGTTSLTLWDKSNRPVSFLVRVTVDSKEMETRVNQAFPGAQVKVRQVGSQIILDGQVPEAKMMSDILQVVQAAIRTSPGFRAMTGGGGATGGAGGGMGGGAGGMGGGMGGGGGGMGGGMGLAIINRVVVPGPRQVLLHVKIAELNRQALRQIGVSWLDTKGQSIIGSSAGGAGSVGATASATHSTGASNPIGLLSPVTSTFDATGTAGSGGQLFGVFNSGHFSLFINALRSNQLAKVLAEPNLVALDGQPARFLVGGNFPYPVPQSSSIPGGTAVVTIQFARFGTILNFIPQILANDVIRLDVEPVVSNLNYAQGTAIAGSTATVPGISERSARTVVELREGQTLAIAGLIQLQTTAYSNRIPGLGDLPLVGPWFSITSVQSVETETMILVTPELVAPLDTNEVTEAPGARVYQPNDAEFFFLGRMEGKLGREFRAPIADQDPLRLMKHFQSEQQWVLGPHGYAD